MRSSSDDSDIGPLIGDLVRTLQDLEAEFEPRTERGFPRPPSPSELVRFTSDVGIPAMILLLRTNIEALKLLQRALRMVDGRPPTTGTGGTEVRQRAEALSRTTLSRLDDALADLQDAVEGRPENDDARELLAEARDLRGDVERKLRERANDGSQSLEDGDALDEDETVEDDAAAQSSVPVDVDAELRSIKREFGEPADQSGGAAAGNGANDTDDPADDSDDDEETPDDDSGGSNADGD